MNQRVAFFRFQELSYVGDADLHLECGGDAVECFDALTGEVLGVLVQVDESGSDYQSGGMDGAASG